MDTKKKVTSENLAEFLIAVRHAHQAMLNLSIKWDEFDGMEEILCDGYPFDKSFDEQVWDVFAWVERLNEHHTKMRLAEFEAWKNNNNKGDTK